MGDEPENGFIFKLTSSKMKWFISKTTLVIFFFIYFPECTEKSCDDMKIQIMDKIYRWKSDFCINNRHQYENFKSFLNFFAVVDDLAIQIMEDERYS